MIKKDIHLFTSLSKWMNIFYYCKKSDRVIGNRDLIANPFFQGYSRSDFDWILDHFLAKWLGFDCQSQKKWSVTTMIITSRKELKTICVLWFQEKNVIRVIMVLGKPNCKLLGHVLKDKFLLGRAIVALDLDDDDFACTLWIQRWM